LGIPCGFCGSIYEDLKDDLLMEFNIEMEKTKQERDAFDIWEIDYKPDEQLVTLGVMHKPW